MFSNSAPFCYTGKAKATVGQKVDTQGLATLQARQQGLQTNLAPSAGTYGYTPKVTYLFGLPQAIEPGGVTMDLDRIARTNGGLTSTDERVRFNTQIGALSSALEHGVPEQMFSTEDHTAEGISAVKALALANQDGQRIYRITPGNQSAVMPKINLSSQVKDEIRAALAAGNEVTTHTDPVAVPGYEGAGYVILNPETGAGAWKIGGGANGGMLSALDGWFDTIGWLLSWLASRLHPFGGQATGAISSAISAIDSLFNCPSPFAQFFAVFAITMYAISVFAVVIGIWVGLPIAGALVGLVIASVTKRWVDDAKENICE